MSESIDVERDIKSGRFLPGNSGFGGRPKGSRNKLGEQFISDLRDAWEEHGADVIARVARDEPAQFLRVIASLMPRDIRVEGHIDVLADVTDALAAFGKLTDMLGAEPKLGARRMQKLKVIEHDP